MEEEEEPNNKEMPLSSQAMVQTMMPPLPAGNMSFPPVNFMANLAMFMQQQNHTLSGRHSAPTIPTAGIPTAAVPPPAAMAEAPAVPVAAPPVVGKRSTISNARKQLRMATTSSTDPKRSLGTHRLGQGID